MSSKWISLEELAEGRFRKAPSTSGIYFVRQLKNGKAICIPRLGSSDNEGVLYIGSAKNLRRRIRELWQGINGKVRAHTIGKTIIFCKVFDIISPAEYQVIWEELQTHKEAVGQESAAIKLYCDKYKEPPPLNLALRREQFAIIGIAIVGKTKVAYDPDSFVKSIFASES